MIDRKIPLAIRAILSFVLVIITSTLYSQPIPSAQREVSGIAKDSIDDAIIGALVVLKTQGDSLKTVTNSQGVFIFRGVSAAEFTISVRSIGYLNFTRKYLYNEATRQIIIDPIILRNSVTSLAEVTIKGSTTITYKQDTTEYRALDYKVKPNAYVEELIRKMEGVNVSESGMVTHQGVPVQRAKLNGQTYAGGGVANAIKSLPAEIVEKIQMIDDYGEQADRTGLKDREPERILNIVTRRDKSVGNRLQTDAALGNSERYDSKLNFTRLNLNTQIVASASLNKSVAGITGGQGFPGTRQGESQNKGGISNFFKGSVGYTGDLNSKMKFSAYYNADSRKNDQVTSSITDEYSQKFGQVLITNDGLSNSHNLIHSVRTHLNYRIDSNKTLSSQMNFDFTKADASDSLTTIQRGGVKQDAAVRNTAFSSNPSYSFSSLYSHYFRQRPGRIFSTSMAIRSAHNVRDRRTDHGYIFYDPIAGNFISDSVVNLHSDITNTTKNYQLSTTFSEPLTLTSKIEFNLQLNNREYFNNQAVDRIVNTIALRADSLSKTYNYSFLEQRYSINYRYFKGKYNVSLGFTVLPSVLNGGSESLHTDIRRRAINVVPLFRAQYSWSKLKSLSLNYNGSPREPSFEQIQNVPDVSNPQNIIIGNPRVKAEFQHSINSSFNNYLANSKWNISLRTRTSFVSNKIAPNIVEIDRSRGTRMTYFENIQGTFSSFAYYDISKQFRNINYKIKLSGSGDFAKSPSLINNTPNQTKTIGTTQTLSLELYPAKWLEINPGARYNLQRVDFKLSSDSRTMETWGVTTSGRVDFVQGLFLNFSASKNYISGVQGSTKNNPLIINSTLSKDFWNRRGTLKVDIFDLLDENNFILRKVDPGSNSITDYRSNISSRYFMFGLILRLQKWTPAPTKDGKEIMRRGDGGFIK